MLGDDAAGTKIQILLPLLIGPKAFLWTASPIKFQHWAMTRTALSLFLTNRTKDEDLMFSREKGKEERTRRRKQSS